MANSWFRLWHDFAIDPKWRAIAHISERPLHMVQAIAVFLMSDASCNDVQRGATKCNALTVACATGCNEADVASVLQAMQGIVLEGNVFINWDKRQPKREREENQASGENPSTLRSRKRRALLRDATATPMQRHATPPDTESDTESDYKIYNQSINPTSTTTARDTKADLTGVLIDDLIKFDGKERGESQPAPPPNANQLIQQADSLIAEIFGENQGRATTHATDADTAQAWIEAGISPKECLDAMRRVCNVLLTRDEPAPRALKYFDKAVYASKNKASSAAAPTEKTPALVGEIQSLQPWVMDLVREGLVEFAWAQSWLEKCKLDGNRILCPSPFHASWLNGSGNHVIAAIEKRKRVNYRIEVAA